MRKKENDNQSYLEKAENSIYSTSDAKAAFNQHDIQGARFKIRNSFENDVFDNKNITPQKRPYIKKVLLVSLFIFLASIFYAGYNLFFSESRTSLIDRNIEMVVTNPAFTRGGEELQVIVTITNKNNTTLTNTQLEIMYPRGSMSENRDDFEIIRLDVSDITPGTQIKKNIPVILYGEQGSKKELQASLEYSLPDSSLTYTKKSIGNITISSSPVVFNFDAPKETVPNQLITGRLRVIQNTENLPQPILVTVSFPRDFKIEAINPKPSFGTGTWVLSTDKNGDYNDIVFTGRFASLEGEERTFLISSGIPKNISGTSIHTSYINQTHTVSLGRPFLEGYILLGQEKQKSIAVNPGSSVEGKIVWSNRSTTSIVKPSFLLKVQGTAVSEKNINVQNGFYDSILDTIVWNSDTDSSLKVIKPGDTGELTFFLNVLPGFEQNTLLSSPSLQMSLSINGIKENTNTLVNLDNVEVASLRVTSLPTLYSSILFARGNNPPKAEKESVYQITLGIKNTYNPISGARVVAKLPFYVKWVGKVTKEEKVAYNQDTREVVWTLDTVQPYTGSQSPKREAAFQVSILPFLSQVGQILDLVKSPIFTGVDSFSGKSVTDTGRDITTRIQEYKEADGVVVE
jgi:hypothetical protein